MKNKGSRIIALCMICLLGLGVVVPIGAAMLGTEEQVEGANVVLDDYCTKVANGTVEGAATPAAVATAAPTPVASAAPQESKPAHVALNLNYSRLGIADKVDTYLNVRKKPSENSKQVGKLIKNAGCHIYSIKKGWAHIVSGKVKGYVKASYITTDKKAEALAQKVGRECVEIQTDSLRVRALPTVSAPIYSVISEGEEFVIKKKEITLDFVKEIVKKEKISKEALDRAGGYEQIQKEMSNFICISVDSDYAFVAKEFVKEQYSLKRAVKVSKVSASKKSGVSSRQASIVEYAKQFLGNRMYGMVPV